MQILSGLILLAVLIIFHEFGHFLFAKLLGVRVLTFSLGFGPKLFGFKYGETEYRLSAIPLGGYIRMFGDSLDQELTEEEKKVSFMHQPIWRKSLIAVAGPLFNFILPVILFFFLLLGSETFYIPKIGTLLPGGVAEAAGILPDDEVKAVNGKPVHSFSALAKIISENPGVDLKFLIDRKNADGKIVEVEIKVKPEVKNQPNPLEKDKSIGRIGIMPARQKPLIWLGGNGALANSGLKDFDEIVAIEHQPISSAHSLEVLWQKAAVGAHLTIERKLGDKSEKITITKPHVMALPLLAEPAVVLNKLAPEEKLTGKEQSAVAHSASLLNAEFLQGARNGGLFTANGAITRVVANSYADSLGLEVGDRLISINGDLLASIFQVQQSLLNPDPSVQILGVLKKDLSPKIIIFKMPQEITEKIDMNSDLLSVFGIETLSVFDEGELKTRQVGPGEALLRAAGQTFDIAKLTAVSLWMLIKGAVPATQIGGPIMLFDVAQKAARKGIDYYIFIMCMLSVNLGLLNLLPIPALDGGHLLLFGIEAIQRKPLSAKTRGLVTQIGVAIVLFLMCLAIFNDLSRLFQ